MPGSQLRVLSIAVKNCLGDGLMVASLAAFGNVFAAVLLFGGRCGIREEAVAVSHILVQPGKRFVRGASQSTRSRLPAKLSPPVLSAAVG